jgi:chromosome segregation protein
MLPRLKSLELHGYKTFAIRTVFEFPGMVTAVVGPNGSGKSNIADALRWVLGEQSYSVLRGKKTEDMIFAGSEQRPRAGMASATITFDNSDGWLPVDYSEVSITRRAFRDGQNEYLLNNQRVRLRDISELLAQCGLSERTYTVIGQGLVDAALALKPEERRRLFEEAAGIGLYRSRKEEALHRLEATQRNLERVQDILAEIEPRLHGLEKQARRVQEYERIKADLRLLLGDWYGYHWYKSQKDLNHVLEILRSQENRLEQGRNHQQKSTQEVGVLRSRVQELRSQLNGYYARVAQENEKMQQVTRDLAVIDEREKSSLDLRRNLESDLVRLEEESKSYTESLTAAEIDRDQIKSELEQNISQAKEARQALQERRKEREGVEISLREKRQGLLSIETRQVQMRAHQQEIAQRINDLHQNSQAVEIAYDKTRLKLSEVQGKLDEAAKAYQLSENGLLNANSELKGYQVKASEIELRRKDWLDQRLKLESETARIRVQVSALVQAEESFSGYTDGVRHLLQSAQQGRIKGSFQALNRFMLVAAEYETAIGAALGEYLDLILSGDQDPENALSFLEKESNGRVALLPLHWVQEDEPIRFPEDPDCLGLACDFIQGEANYQPIIRLLLGSVVIVRNRTAAHRILGGLPSRARAVTLRGELFNANGLVLAGTPGRTGSIGRTRQKRELETKLNQLVSQIVGLNHEIEQVNRSLAELRIAISEQNKEVRSATEEHESDRKTYQNAQLVFEQVERQSQWHASQRIDLEKQLNKAENEKKQVADSLDVVESQIVVCRDQIKELSADLVKLPLEEFDMQVVHWETACAVLTRALQDAEKRVKDRRQIQAANQQRREIVQLRLGEATVSLEKNHALQSQIDPLALELVENDKKLESLQARDIAAQQALNVAERYHTQAQLDYSRQREAMDALRRRIEDDMGLVTLEYEANVSGPTPLPFEGMVEQLPVITELPAVIDESITRQRAQLRRMGAINPDAQVEYNSVLERYQFLTTQVADLRKADSSLREVIAELDGLMKRDFTKTFNAVASEFRLMFTRLFGGGSARLVLFDEENPQESGIDIEARLPGRREQGLSLLSGGERSLAAAALVFALLKVSPTPFCVMDEVDAMLDEANVGRFVSLLRELSHDTQFILITHNRNTVQAADVIYGVTMGQDSISQLISLKLDEIDEEMVR